MKAMVLLTEREVEIVRMGLVLVAENTPETEVKKADLEAINDALRDGQNAALRRAS